jgi:hypothetical protein
MSRSLTNTLALPPHSNQWDKFSEPITATSTPAWGFFGLFGQAWSGEDFIAWHRALVAAYGADRAKQIFSDTWTNRPMTSAFGTGWQASMFDENFRNYFKAQGFTWSTSGDIIVGTSVLAKDVVKTAENLGKGASNLSDTLAKIAKWLPYVVIVAAVAVGGYFIYKKIK